MKPGRVSLEGRRVCLVGRSRYPSDLYMRREAESLASSGCRISVICQRGKGEPIHEKRDDIDIYRMPVKRFERAINRYLFEYGAFFALSSLQLIALHIMKHFHAVQVNTAPGCLIFIAGIPKLTGTRLIFSMRKPAPEFFEATSRSWYGKLLVPLINLVEKLSLRFADHALTGSREMRDNLGRKGADVNKISVVVNMPDESSFHPEDYEKLYEKIAAIKKEERRKGMFRILFRGPVEENSGLDVVVKAIANLKQRLPGVQFRISGKGNYSVGIRELAKTLKVEGQVENIEFASNDRIIEEVLAADAGIIPTRENPHSNLVHPPEIYELIAMRIPVIASRLESVAAYFPEDAIVYFESGNDKDLADKIHYLFAHPEEIEHRNQAAREICTTYGWEREGKKYLGIYQTLLTSGTQ
ncbi:MAG: glycosyltransferase [Candidatus Latescibacteria bacterium]|nr:glycosyltransferase [Candidatus Latescibacterota bacterium]NIM22265.1 glycosyltransferase [Candidatus Latescibacterota bacterium]NIM65744.1 glycosyltransferase [Candidatus Latescibacterota bacterium]NIO02129.1 glycosyltransferase [Candidatus Latescibacterota bacterium]NIO28961.1 glycosyltransferase [Candidatus Latescibacterota bacterium]